MAPPTDYVLTIEYPPGDSAIEDAVQAVLFLSTTLGSTIGERDGRTVVESYFVSSEARDAAAQMLHDLPIACRFEERLHQDWLELYRQSLQPVPIGRRVVVVADASIESDPSRLRIVIPQERAFGTGSHESTALCIELLEELNLAGTFCLDVGTGSGILAIAMAIFAARRVVALDNDFDTYGVIQRNVTRNAVAPGTILPFYGELRALQRTSFDVVTMNIIPEVIAPLLPDTRGLMSPNGSLIVSGVTADRRDGLVERAAATGLVIATERMKNEWWAAVLRPQSPM